MTHPVYGFNAGLPGAGLWEAARGAVGPFAGWRCYNTPTQGIPAFWPGTGSGARPDGATLVVSSIKPDPNRVSSGACDLALKQFVTAASPGDYVCLWHEGETGDGWTPEQLRAMHTHAYGVVKAARPDVHYIQIVAAYTASAYSKYHPLEQWITPGLDCYGIDGYHQQSGQTVDAVWGASARAIRSVAGKGARLAVTECNAVAFDNAGAPRAQWFHDSYRWARYHDCALFFPWYGLDKYAWLADDKVTIAELAREYRVSSS